MKEREVRVRFAPSPTGPLHIGGVRTALYNYLFARHHGGKLLLRIEDTDSQRFVEGAEEYIIESFRWLGITFDEGVGIGGPHGPYRQSERRDIYRKYVQYLLDNGKAYYAFDTPEELEQERAADQSFRYDASSRLRLKNSLTLSKEEVASRIAQGEQYVVRFLIQPGEEVSVCDIIRGEVKFDSSLLDDKVLYKSADDLPTYHLANIVDDHLMEISHVIRGEEWLPSAPLHVLLYRAFGWEESMPQFAHLALLLKPEGNGKLSKRDGDRLGFPVFPLEWHDPKTQSISRGYREDGYLPEAVVNFVALLGWNPGADYEEVLSMEEMVQAFSLEKCSKAGARFDYEKGKWFNHHYITTYPLDSLVALIEPTPEARALPEESRKLLPEVVALVRDRMTLLTDFWEQAKFFFVAPTEYDERTAKKRWSPEIAKALSELLDLLAKQHLFVKESLEPMVKGWIKEQELNMGAVMNCLRLALVGKPMGPDLFDIMNLLGRDETLSRIERIINTLGR